MAKDITDNSFITNEDMLSAYFRAGAKPKSQWRLGVEHEKFAYQRKDFAFLPYEGSISIKTLLEACQKQLQWQGIFDQKTLIGLVDPQTGASLSLEPGGQFEYASPPLANVHQSLADFRQHFQTICQIAQPLGINFLCFGANPVASLAEIPKMPKTRYTLMRAYMPKVGKLGLDMMHRTATTQVSLDYSSEEDMRQKFLLGLKVQPLITALFALSPFTEGKTNGFLSWRAHIWQDTDKARTGILPFVFEQDFGFKDYVNWALDVPMYFVLRDGRYHDATHMTFRQFLENGFKGKIAQPMPTMGDWINHLSTLFPEVRLKQYLEMRGADSGPLPKICALAALFAGIFYQEEAFHQAKTLTQDWDYAKVRAMYQAVPKEGLSYKIDNSPLWEVAHDILNIAEKGLKQRAFYNQMQQDETIYLAPLRKIIEQHKSDADHVLAQYHQLWGEDISILFKEADYNLCTL